MTAAVNPERATKALTNLVEEMFPEVAKDRERAVEKALEIMEKETSRTYSVAPVGGSLKKGPWGRIQNILKQKRRGRRPG